MSTPIINAQMDAINGSMAILKSDLTTLRPLIKTLKETAFNAYATESLSNQAIASFTDGANNVPVKSLSVAVTPVQNLNGQANPYPAGGGKNLSPLGSVTSASDGGVSRNNATIFENIVQGTTYTLSFDMLVSQSSSITDAQRLGVWINNGGTTLLRPPKTATGHQTVTFTASESGYLNFWCAANAYTASTKVIDHIQLEIGSETSFAPYSNICPITGWSAANVTRTGKNLFDEPNTTVYKRYMNASDKWMGDANSGSYAFPCKPDTDYVISAHNDELTIFRAGYVTDDDLTNTGEQVYSVTRLTGSGSIQLHTGADATYIIVQCNAAIVNAKNTQLQIEYSTTASAYEAYIGNTYPISLGQTVYGGTLNVKTGVLTIEYAKKTMTGTGSNTGTSFAGKASVSNVDGYYAQFYQSNGAANIPLSDVISHIRCSQAKVVAYADSADVARAGTVAFTWSTTTSTPVRIQPRIYFPTSAGIDTTEKANQFLADQYAAGTPVEYIYKLATPTTVQLTPTEVKTVLGANNIWADTGDITEITIRCDTALYLQKLVG